MAALRSCRLEGDTLTLVRPDGQTLVVTKADVVAYRQTHNINETRTYFRDMLGNFIGIPPGEISNRTLMQIANDGTLEGLTIKFGSL